MVDLSRDKLFYVSRGIIFKVVCAPKSWDKERIEDQATRDGPPGTTNNRWEVAEPHERQDKFNNINVIPCHECEDRQHWLLNC